MAIGSGLGSQVGYSVESVYGTYVAPTKFLRAMPYAAKPIPTRVQGDGIQAGILGDIGAHYVETVTQATGHMGFDVQSVLMGPLIQTLMGTSVTPAAITGSTGAYGQTHTLADNFGKSLSFQVGAPYRATGTVRPHTITGAKITSLSLNCEQAGLLKATVDFVAKQFVTTQTLAAASYVASRVFRGGGNGTLSTMSVKMGTFGSESAVTGIKSVTCKIDRPMQTDDFTAGSAGLKNEPVLNNTTQITGAITADWLDTTVFQDIALANTPTSLVLEWTDTVAITGSTYPTFRVTIPGVYFTADAQDVPGRDVLSNAWNYVWKYDGTNLPVIYIVSTEVAL